MNAIHKFNDFNTTSYFSKSRYLIIHHAHLPGMIKMQDTSLIVENKPAYFVAEFWLNDLEPMQTYSSQVLATLIPFNGKLIVRNNQTVPLEGESIANAAIVILEFPSMQHAKNWYYSKAYQKIIPLRHKAGKTNAYLVEGLTLPSS